VPAFSCLGFALSPFERLQPVAAPWQTRLRPLSISAAAIFIYIKKSFLDNKSKKGQLTEQGLAGQIMTTTSPQTLCMYDIIIMEGTIA
jgi:hypothetical protein